MSTSSAYDYVIVGGGTAGLVIANRLSEDPDVTVLVLEAGTDASSDPRVAIPGLWGALLGSELDWAFGTVEQKELKGRRIGHSQGRMLGGSSSINLQALIPFSASDINAWEQLGNRGWNWKTISPYLKRSFSLSLPDEETCAHLNIGWARNLVGNPDGPVKASFADVKQNPIGKAWVETFDNLGYPLSASPFEGHATGAYNAASTINPKTKTRSSAHVSYNIPASGRANLTIMTGALARRIILEAGKPASEPRASGVEFIQNNKDVRVMAKREVIICSGVFNTPKLLELSGIGDPDILRQHEIDVQVNNPYVGTNLQDHPLCGISFEAADGVPTGDNLLRQDPSALQEAMAMYQSHQVGPFACSGVTSFGYLPTVDLIQDTSAQQKLLDVIASIDSTHPLDEARQKFIRYLLQAKDEGTGQYFLFGAQSAPAGHDSLPGQGLQPLSGNFISLISALSHPLSTGTTHIVSADVLQPPTIDHNYLSHPADLELLARHTRYLEKIAATEPFAGLLKPDGKRNSPEAYLNGDLHRAEELVRTASISNWHSCGTCAMSPKEKGGVVDENLQVYGIKGLRIVDASVFPLVPQSNLQSLVYVVAERASDIIRGRV